MSKCREAFDAYCNNQGFTKEDIDGPLHELIYAFEAAWNAATLNAVEICRERANRIGAASALGCAEAIEQEQCE